MVSAHGAARAQFRAALSKQRGMRCCSAEGGGGVPGFCSGLLNYRLVCVGRWGVCIHDVTPPMCAGMGGRCAYMILILDKHKTPAVLVAGLVHICPGDCAGPRDDQPHHTIF